MSTKKKSDSIKFMEKATGGPLTIGRILYSIRKRDELTQAELAQRLGISRVHLTQIEKGQKTVSPERAQTFAKMLGDSTLFFVELSVQEMLIKAGIKARVRIEAA